MPMLTRATAILLLAAASACGQYATVVFNLNDHVFSGALSNRTMRVTPHITNGLSVDLTILTRDRRNYLSDSSGVVTITNMYGPLNYTCEIIGPYTNTTFQITVPLTNGTLYASTLRTVSTNGITGAVTQDAGDSRWLRNIIQSNGVAIATNRSLNFIQGTNMAIRYTNNVANNTIDVYLSSSAAGGGGSSITVSPTFGVLASDVLYAPATMTLTNLLVGGTTTLGGLLTTEGVQVDGAFNAGNATIAGTLQVDGVSNLGGGATLADPLEVNSSSQLNGTLDVTGVATFATNVVILRTNIVAYIKITEGAAEGKYLKSLDSSGIGVWADISSIQLSNYVAQLNGLATNLSTFGTFNLSDIIVWDNTDVHASNLWSFQGGITLNAGSSAQAPFTIGADGSFTTDGPATINGPLTYQSYQITGNIIDAANGPKQFIIMDANKTLTLSNFTTEVRQVHVTVINTNAAYTFNVSGLDATNYNSAVGLPVATTNGVSDYWFWVENGRTNARFMGKELQQLFGGGIVASTNGYSVTWSTTGTDSTAIHDDASGEIAAITSKATPVGADLLLIEDSAASNAKKSIAISALEDPLEAILDLPNLQGAVTDAQVPNTITIDLATLATTATTANAGDSATAFFSAGTIEDARLPATLDGKNLTTSTATTPAENDNDTSVATTAYVQTEIAGLGGGSMDYDTASITNYTLLGTNYFHAVGDPPSGGAAGSTVPIWEAISHTNNSQSHSRFGLYLAEAANGMASSVSNRFWSVGFNGDQATQPVMVWRFENRFHPDGVPRSELYPSCYSTNGIQDKRPWMFEWYWDGTFAGPYYRGDHYFTDIHNGTNFFHIGAIGGNMGNHFMKGTLALQGGVAYNSGFAAFDIQDRGFITWNSTDESLNYYSRVASDETTWILGKNSGSTHTGIKFEGLAIATAPVTVSLTADNQTVNCTNRSYIQLSSTSGTASQRTFVLTANVAAMSGQLITLEWTGTNAGEIADDSSMTGGGNVRLSAGWTPTQYDTLTLRFNGTDLVEEGRSTN